MKRPGPVLIVDDDEATREMFKFVIEQRGCEVVTASNGLEALEELKKPVKPCLLFMDLMMPLMDGAALDRKLAHDPELASIPAIVITAFPEKETQLKRALTVMHKPVDIEEIIGVVLQYCGPDDQDKSRPH